MWKKNIILIGFMGTGKTTTGKVLAAELGLPHRDLDEVIAQREGRSISEIFRAKGEQYFRDRETAALEQLLAQQGQVLTTGGGAVLRPENVALMQKAGTVVALTAAEDELIKRLQNDSGRPLLAGGVAEQVRRLLAERKGAYDFAPIQIDTTNKPVSEIVAEILRHMVEKEENGQN